MSDLDFLNMFGSEQELAHDICKNYPNPSFYRSPFLILNGPFKFTVNNSQLIPSNYDMEIFVPYIINSKNSRVNVKINKKSHYHYHLDFSLDESMIDENVFLNIERLNGSFTIYINGHKCYQNYDNINLSLNIRDYIAIGNNTLDLDFTLYKTKSIGISGSVYINKAKTNEIKSVDIIADSKNKSVTFNIDSVNNSGEIKIISPNGNIQIEKYKNNKILIDLNDNVFYFPNSPFFYQYTITTSSDQISGVFTLANYSLGTTNNIPTFNINNEPYPIRGVINCNNYANGNLTFDSYEQIDNIFYNLKKIGFNSILLDNKIELPYYYYSALTKGILIAHKLIFNNYSDFRNTINYISKYPNNFLLIIENKNNKIENRSIYSFIKGIINNSIIIVLNKNKKYGDIELIQKNTDYHKLLKNNTRYFLINNFSYKKDQINKFVNFIKCKYVKYSINGLIGFYYSSLSGIKDGIFNQDLIDIKEESKLISECINKL